MNKYYVKAEDKRIYAGTMKDDKWTKKNDVTEETLAAVRDHLMQIAVAEKLEDIGYSWNYNNGTTIVLKIEAIKTEEIKEEKDV